MFSSCRISFFVLVSMLVSLSSACMTGGNHSSTKVVGGSLASSTGSALFITDQKDEMICGAVYLGEGWALTNAFCAVSSGKPLELSWANDTKSIGDKRVPVELVLPSPKLGGSRKLAGLALLYVNKDLEAEGVEPVSLPTRPVPQDGGEKLTFFGHGSTSFDGQGRGTGLRQINLTSYSLESCRDSINTIINSPKLLSPDAPIICAPQNMGENPKGIGYWDSGSGLIRPKTQDESPELVGIALQLPARDSDTSMFIDVYQYLNWIILSKAGVQDEIVEGDVIAEGICYNIGSERNIDVKLKQKEVASSIGIRFISAIYERKEILVIPKLAPIDLKCDGARFDNESTKVSFFVALPDLDKVVMKVTTGSSTKFFEVGDVDLGYFLMETPNRSFKFFLTMDKVVPPQDDRIGTGIIEKLGKLPLYLRYTAPYQDGDDEFNIGDQYTTFFGEDSAGFGYFGRLWPDNQMTPSVSDEDRPDEDEEKFVFPYFELSLQQMPDPQLAIVRLSFQGTPVIHHQVTVSPKKPGGRSHINAAEAESKGPGGQGK